MKKKSVFVTMLIILIVVAFSIVNMCVKEHTPADAEVTVNPSSDSIDTSKNYSDDGAGDSHKTSQAENVSSELETLQNGDFSRFAGTYIATPEDNDAYGGGEKMKPLELKADGSLSGGMPSFMEEDYYPKKTPISVSQNKDGSYKCVMEKGVIYDPSDPEDKGAAYESYYTIYPAGVIEDSEYVRENQAYLKDVIYISCCFVDGGVFAPTYYSDSLANTVTNYAGDDWVSQEAYIEGNGKKFVSGTGVEYRVVAEENNFAAGGSRTRIVLETKDGKRWMIPNLPASSYDEQTGIIYFNIYEYVRNPDYVEDSNR